jgi:nickel-dependent lactate racemase
VKVISHDAYDPDSLFLFDATEKGIPIRLNRLVREADFIIAVGTLEPHRIAGFSGGAKMVLPGICGEEIVADTHWQAWLEEGPNVYGKIDTPMRQLMESVADRVGLKFIVNTILDETGHILRYFVGDPRRAFRAGCQEVERLFAVPVRSADIVIADSYPFDIDLWQACKAVSVAELVLRRNGTIILVTPCPEGLSRHDSRIRKFGYLKKSEIVSRVADGSIDDLATACHLMSLGRILEQGQLIIVSNGLGPELLGQVGLQGARCVDDAIGIARERLGKGAEVCILKHPCAFLPKAA